MSTYTTELRWIAETLTEKTKVIEVVENFRPLLFNFVYPFPEDKKRGLENKIILHFYNREIGYETWELFHIKFMERMFLIMPYFNALASQIEKISEKMFDDIDYTETSENISTAENSGNSSGSGASTDKTRHSDTPMGGLSNLENDTYMSSADLSNSTNSSTASTNATADSLSETTVKRKGKTSGKSYIEMLDSINEKYLNIENEIIKKLSDLFMGVY